MSGLRLTWRDADDFGVWAQAGNLLLNAWCLRDTSGADGYCWNVLAQNVDNNASEDFNTVASIDTPVGAGLATMLDAQLAAESAAVDLLCSALAAFGGEAPSAARITRCGDAGIRVDTYHAMTDDDCRRLAIALLAATRRDVK